jgi:hypothetical protein
MKPQSLPPSAIRKGGLLSLGSKIFFLPLFNFKPFYFSSECPDECPRKVLPSFKFFTV